MLDKDSEIYYYFSQNRVERAIAQDKRVHTRDNLPREHIRLLAIL